MNKYLSCLGLLRTLLERTPLLAQTSKATTKQQATTDPSHTERVKKYQDWLVEEGYRPVKHEREKWTYLEFKSEGETLYFYIDKDDDWVCLAASLILPEDAKDLVALWWCLSNKTNIEYRAVQVNLSKKGDSVDFKLWAIDPKPEYIETYIIILNAAKKFHRETYDEAIQQLEEEAETQSETEKK